MRKETRSKNNNSVTEENEIIHQDFFNDFEDDFDEDDILAPLSELDELPSNETQTPDKHYTNLPTIVVSNSDRKKLDLKNNFDTDTKENKQALSASSTTFTVGSIQTLDVESIDLSPTIEDDFAQPDPDSKAESDVDQKQKNQQPEAQLLVLTQLLKMLGMANQLQQMFQKIFNPTTSQGIEFQQMNAESMEQAAALITNPRSTLTTPLIGNTGSPDPKFKSSEFKTIAELMLRVGKQNRPQYFADLTEEELASPDILFKIGNRFLQEFVQQGPLDTLTAQAHKTIEAEEMDDSKRAAYHEVTNEFLNFFKYMGSDAVNDYTQDPLNKYVDPTYIPRIRELNTWLEHNDTKHQDYEAKHQEFLALDQTIKANRQRALEEGNQNMFALLKRVQPELADIKTPDEMFAYQKTQWATSTRIEFENYVLQEYAELDIFEPNHLRAFWEKLQRHQYGNLCFKIVCESSQSQYENSDVHQIVRRIWSISHLDTIHINPQEAKSRMPTASVDGLPASNFGYDIAKSPAYQEWTKRPFVRACSDIIMDAFHWVVDFASNLNIEIFLTRLKQDFSDEKNDGLDFFKNPHEYDTFLIPFQFFLLEKTFCVTFIEDNSKTVTSELKRAAGTPHDLLQNAEAALKNLKDFAKELLKLRPSEEKLSKSEEFRGLVFGIGFNGIAFDAPSHSHPNSNEIWISFSSSGRTPGGNLFLEFIIHTMRYGLMNTASNDPNHPNTATCFQKYRFFIKKHIEQKIKNTHCMPDIQLDSLSLAYVKKERAKFEGFLAQLELSFDQITPEFKNWIIDKSNWYHIPNYRDRYDPDRITLHIPDEMPQEEYATQVLARDLLFDALSRRRFSQERADLMPLLFLHWKKELTTTLTHSPEAQAAISSATELEEIPSQFKKVTLSTLDQLVWQVHAEIQTIWNPEIDKQFKIFMKSHDVFQVDHIEQKLAVIPNNIKKMKLNLEKAKQHQSKNFDTIKKKLNAAQKELEDFEARKKQWPRNPDELSPEDFHQFKELFFRKRDVMQCLEPVFARVVGHDRFFSIYIAKKASQVDILDYTDLHHKPLQFGNRIPQSVIAPCNKRCQFHALGHLYVGDMLSYQSADRLDYMRQTHGLGTVLDRFMTFDEMDRKLQNTTQNRMQTQTVTRRLQPTLMPPPPENQQSTSDKKERVSKALLEAEKNEEISTPGNHTIKNSNL